MIIDGPKSLSKDSSETYVTHLSPTIVRGGYLVQGTNEKTGVTYLFVYNPESEISDVSPFLSDVCIFKPNGDVTKVSRNVIKSPAHIASFITGVSRNR